MAQAPSCAQSFNPPPPPMSVAPSSYTGGRNVARKADDEKTVLFSTHSRCSNPLPEINVSQNLGDYIKFSNAKTPYFQGNNLVVPGVSLRAPDFEKRYEEKFEKLAANLAAVSNTNTIRVKDSLNYFVHLCILLQFVIFIGLFVWILYRAFQ